MLVVELYLRALRGYKKARGEDHTSTLDTFNNLGNLYKDLGKMEEAESVYSRALRGYEKARGANHPSTLLVARDLADLQQSRAEFKKAQ